MSKVTFQDKAKLKDSGVPDVNTVRAVDLNEIKEAINDNDDRIVEHPTRVDMGVSNVIDWANPNGVFLKTMTANTTFTDSNLPTGIDTKKINFYLQGLFTPLFPSYYIQIGDVNFGQDGVYKYEIQCVNGSIGNELVYYEALKTKGLIFPPTLKNGLITVLDFEETSGNTCFDTHGSFDFTSVETIISETGIMGNAKTFSKTV